MTKLYGVSCHHLCHHLCHQLLLPWYNGTFHAIVCVTISCDCLLLSLMDYCQRLDRIKSIVVNGWWRGVAWRGVAWRGMA